MESRTAQRRRPSLQVGTTRKLALLRATEDLLVSVGPHALTVEEISKRAGVSRTAFYTYFASKEEAVGRLAELYLGDAVTVGRPAFDETIPLEQGVHATVEATIQVWKRHGLALAAVADLASTDPTVREIWTNAVDSFVEPLHELMADIQRKNGQRPSRRNRARAEAVVWMFERYLRVWGSGHCKHPPKTVADTLSEIFLAVVRL